MQSKSRKQQTLLGVSVHEVDRKKQVVCTEASQKEGLGFEPDRWFGSFHALSTCGCSDLFTLSKGMDVRQYGVNMAVNVDVNGHLSVCFSPGCASPGSSLLK